MRNLLVIGTFLTLSLGLVMAEEFQASIVKVEGSKVTFAKMEGKGKDAKKGEEMTLPATDSVKVVKGKFNMDTKKMEAGEALEGGLKNEAVKAGARATITTDADGKHITGIMIGGGKKKKDV